jgi:hypothetical protein
MPTLQREDLGLHFEESGPAIPILLTHSFGHIGDVYGHRSRLGTSNTG